MPCLDVRELRWQAALFTVAIGVMSKIKKAAKKP